MIFCDQESFYTNTTITTTLLLWICLQSFSAVGWVAGRASGLYKNGDVGCRRAYLSGARCRLAYGPADANATHSLLLQ